LLYESLNQEVRLLNRALVIKKDDLFFLIIFSIIILFTSVDIITDLQEGLSLEHISHEVGISLLCLILIFYQLKVIRRKRITIINIEKNVEQLSQENREIKNQLKKLSGDFHQIINLQMVQWKFSDGEKDIGKLIMKGLSMKEIAEIRQTTESTVRQQATSIYRKANLHGRQEFIAYFLEDL